MLSHPQNMLFTLPLPSHYKQESTEFSPLQMSTTITIFSFEETTSNFSLKEKCTKVSSHLKTTSNPIAFHCKVEHWLRSWKSNFTHGINKIESYKNNPHHTPGDLVAFVPTVYWQQVITGSKATTLHKVLGLEFPQLNFGREKGNFLQKKNLEKLQMLTFKHQKKMITD